MTKKKLIEKAEQAKNEGKIIRCGAVAVNNVRTATIAKKAILTTGRK